MSFKNLGTTLRTTASAWSDHEAPRLGAALAFYTILSLAPLVILTVALVALVFGRSAAQGHILSQVQEMIGKSGADAVRAMIEHGQKRSSGILASIIGVITLLFGASGAFGELRTALNKIWDVKPQNEGGMMGMIRQRIFSFGMVLGIGFLLLVSLIISAGLEALGKFFAGILPIPDPILGALNFVISFAGITVLFALIYKYVPETKIAWEEVWLGAAFTSFLFAVGKFLIGLYLGRASVGSAYGAAGSLIVIIVWVYYSAQIFFFGAEFTHVFADREGKALSTRNAGQTRAQAGGGR